LTYFRPELLSVVIQSNTLEQSVSTRANTCSKCAQFSDNVQDLNGLIDSAPPPPLEKLHGCSTVASRALRPSRQESQTAQRRPLGPNTDSSPLELLDHPGRSHRPLRDDRSDRT
jgi:hypothetical protein